MHVDHLYIVGLLSQGLDNDTPKCVKALESRHAGKAKKVRSLILESSQSEGTEVNSAAQSNPKTTVLTASQSADPENPTVGMYLVGNFVWQAQKLEYHSGQAVAELVAQVVGGKLDYINLVACRAGGKVDNGNENLDGRKFITDFCAALATCSPSLRPIIAGYTAYVDVLFPGAVRSLDPRSSQPDLEIPETDTGRKIVTMTNSQNKLTKDLTKEERKIKKAFYQYSDTSPKRLEGRLSWKSSEQ